MTKKTLGVVVGRFQVPELHDGHLHLIIEAGRNNTNVLVLIGTTPVKGDFDNALDFQDRYQMVAQAYIYKQVETSRLLGGKSILGDLNAQPLPDQEEDVYWSQSVQKRIHDEMERLGVDAEDVTCYGGRDSSFLREYLGPHKKVEVEEIPMLSGTAVRNALVPEQTRSYRVGKFLAAKDRYPTAYSTIDAVIYCPETDKFLIGRKPGTTLYCFVGGFVDPTDANLEAAVMREVGEEVRYPNDEPYKVVSASYLGSFLVDDWRYRNSRDKIMTKVFLAITPTQDIVKPGDDLKGGEVRWVTREELRFLIKKNHQPIVDIINEKVK